MARRNVGHRLSGLMNAFRGSRSGSRCACGSGCERSGARRSGRLDADGADGTAHGGRLAWHTGDAAARTDG
jgi:hypothetical protein